MNSLEFTEIVKEILRQAKNMKRTLTNDDFNHISVNGNLSQVDCGSTGVQEGIDQSPSSRALVQTDAGMKPIPVDRSFFRETIEPEFIQ